MPGLTAPLSFKGLKFANRVVIPPIASDTATTEGHVTEKTFENYRRYADSGAAMIIVEHCFSLPSGRFSEGQMGVHDDSCIEGISYIAKIIKKAGVVSCLQVSNAGSRVKPGTLSHAPFAPSAVINNQMPGAEMPQAMTLEQIRQAVAAYADAALRVKQAGFDAVELHAAHGFLLSQFLSPLTNLREDEFGADLAGRSRIHFEVIKAVRAKVGPDYPVFMRLGACDDMEGGLRLEESTAIAPALAAAGIDMLDISGGLQGSRPLIDREGFFAHFAEAIKKVVSIPVMTTGGIKTPQAADAIVSESKADLVGVARTVMKHPHWPKQAIAAL